MGERRFGLRVLFAGFVARGIEAEEGFFDRRVWARYVADVLASDKPAEERIAKFLGRRWSTERMRGVVGKLFVAPH